MGDGDHVHHRERVSENQRQQNANPGGFQTILLSDFSINISGHHHCAILDLHRDVLHNPLVPIFATPCCHQQIHGMWREPTDEHTKNHLPSAEHSMFIAGVIFRASSSVTDHFAPNAKTLAEWIGVVRF
jgi:hypothetical protein